MKTLESCIYEWLASYKKNTVKEATYDRLIVAYKALCRHHISRIDPVQLQPRDIQEYINSLVNDGYSLSTIKKQYNLLSAYLRYANTEGIISRPIYNNVHLPTQSNVKKRKREIEAYSKPEQVALSKVLRTRKRPGYAAALLMLETGLRVGEVLALSWSDVDWDRQAIRVNKTLIRLTEKKRIKVQDGAKSYTSNRLVPLSKTAYMLLEEMLEEVDSLDGGIFRSEDGSLLSYEAMRWQIQRACEEAHVPYKGQHVFRHTFATNCYKKGADVKILSKLLGHASVAITFNTYIHLYGDALEEMRSVVA